MRGPHKPWRVNLHISIFSLAPRRLSRYIAPMVTRLSLIAMGVVSAAVAVVFTLAPGSDAAPDAASGYPIRAVPLAAVTIDDRFWAPRIQTNDRVTIPHIMQQNESTGRVANFARAARKATGAYQGRRFNDTDVYKSDMAVWIP